MKRNGTKEDLVQQEGNGDTVERLIEGRESNERKTLQSTASTGLRITAPSLDPRSKQEF